ncbi:MAG: DNA repair protein RadA [Mailhella sp.]|jgi:DNA repair protein RadA/Sms|nr:DNA repair protein RadA [Mailhella sp.]
MTKVREFYICRNCHAQSMQWHGQCPRCREWNTLVPAQGVPRAAGRPPSPQGTPGIIPLADAPSQAPHGFSTGCQPLDGLLGGGFMPGASLLISGEPGIGKSTLLLQLAGSAAREGKTAIYASGEETLSQVRSRAERLGVLHPRLLAVSTTRMEDILPRLEAGGSPPDLLIIDSVQTMSAESAEGLPGNVTQVRAVSGELVSRCKHCGTALVLVGHVTKDGVLAGPRLLEHLVDTVISLEGDRKESYRLLRVLKNRFGPNQELLLFRMERRGMELIEDPSTLFLGTHDPSLSGTALVMTMDGQRPFAVEIQALAAKSWLAAPRRAALGFDVNRLYMLLAVIEKRLRINFAQADIYAKIGGGIRMQEPGLDLPLVAAILSSYYDKPLPERCILWGEIDLNGQIRAVHGHDIRMNQAKKLGYAPIICQNKDHTGPIGSLADLHSFLFRRT